MKKYSYTCFRDVLIMGTDSTEIETSFGDVIYECINCGTTVKADELKRLPEIKCICGYRILKKVRPAVIKQVKAV